MPTPSTPPPAGPVRLDVQYYQQMLAQHSRVVIAAPCGAGKTTTAADLIAQTWREGVLYVAERVEQLRTMRELLLHRDVPPEVIGLYAAGSPDQQALRHESIQKPIALLTHVRMQMYAPHAYVLFPTRGGMATRRLLIVDESITPLLILSAPKLFIQAFLSEMSLQWSDTGQLDPETMDRKLAAIDALLQQHARYPLTRVGIRYQTWADALPGSGAMYDIHYYTYYQLLYQVLSGRYLTREQDIDVLIPLAPHLTWYRLFAHILVLDATAHLTDFLYTDYQLVSPGPWHHTAITEARKVYSGLGDLTKTRLVDHPELFLKEFQDCILPLISTCADPYVVTYKQMVEPLQPLLPYPVQHYGTTRGSNAYRTKDAAVLVGAYRPPVRFDELAYLLFGQTYSPYKMAVAHWLQELYRTRIREGHPITLLVMGEREALDLFQQTLQLTLWPSTIGGSENPDGLEALLQQVHARVEQALLQQLLTEKVVEMKAFARQHTNYDTRKVQRALRGILQCHPRFEGHVIADETTIRLIDKPAPRR